MQLKRTLSLCLFALAGLPLAGATIKPESVGLSEERLSRIHDTMQRHMDAHDISGAVTLVARKGQIAWLHAQGLMNIEADKPIQKDAIFRVFSMSKPVCGVAILMLLEEGKVRLNDPVSKFIPEFKGPRVAVVQDRRANAPASGQALSEKAVWQTAIPIVSPSPTTGCKHSTTDRSPSPTRTTNTSSGIR